MAAKKNTSYYIHGVTPAEQERLSMLNTILNDGCLRELGLRGGEYILDVGSGLGQFSRQMAQQAGRKVIGIERDPAQIEAARRFAAAAGEEGLADFRQGDARRLPLAKQEWGSFDIVHTRFLLEHVDHPEAVLGQMVAAARPGGRVVVSDDDHSTFQPTPAPAGFHDLWEAYCRAYDRAGNDPYIGRRLVSLLHDAGLQQIRNTIVFFGSCASQPLFPAVADNLIGILNGARTFILEQRLLTASSFDQAIAGLHTWKALPDAALWYGICWAEGRKQAAPGK